MGHSLPNETEFSAQDEAREGDEEEAEYQQGQSDETTEKRSWCDFAIAYRCYGWRKGKRYSGGVKGSDILTSTNL